MTIKHLVFSGGGPVIFQMLGSIQELRNNNYIDIDKIETIYGTSAGAIIGFLMCLKYDNETIHDYFIKRPWKDVFSIKAQNIFDAYSKRGLFDIKTIEKALKPLLDAKDIPMDINFKDFYELSKIELHLFSLEMNEYKITDFSYLTHPELPVIHAIYMSCSIPLYFSPIIENNKCYIDPGFICNYPLENCIQSGKIHDEIFGFKNVLVNQELNIHTESTILDFIFNFVLKVLFKYHEYPNIKNEINYDKINNSDIEIWKNTLYSIETRENLFKIGCESVVTFLSINEIQKV